MNVMNYATRDVPAIGPSESIDRAIKLMEERGVHHLVVCRNGRVVGMISDRDVLISTAWMFSEERAVNRGAGRVVLGPTRVEQIMSRSVACLNQASSARVAAYIMLNERIGAIPIVGDDTLVALVTETDLLHWLSELDTRADHLLGRRVGDLMPARVISVGPDAQVENVISIFRIFRVRHVPVTAPEGSLAGIISDRDVRRALAWSRTRDMQADAERRISDAEEPATAEDIMQEKVETITPDEPLRSALRRMLDLRIYSLPGVEGRKVVGIITMTDFTKAIAREELL